MIKRTSLFLALLVLVSAVFCSCQPVRQSAGLPTGSTANPSPSPSDASPAPQTSAEPQDSPSPVPTPSPQATATPLPHIDCNLYVYGSYQEQPAYTVPGNGRIMLPLVSTCQALSGQAQENIESSSLRVVLISPDGITYELVGGKEPGAYALSRQGTEVILPSPLYVETKNGLIYASSGLFEAIFSVQVSINGAGDILLDQPEPEPEPEPASH